MVFSMSLYPNEDFSAYCGRDEKHISPVIQPLDSLDPNSDDSSPADDLTYIQPPMSETDTTDAGNPPSPLFGLPPELLQQILSYFSAQDLARVGATCHVLAEHASNELLWSNLVNAHLPFKIYDPGPFESFRRLYIAHHPYWFIPRNKIWFSDVEHTGTLIVSRYDNRRGVIEAYRVVAQRRAHHFQVWNWNPDVMIQTFDPKVRLWLDDPLLVFKDCPPTKSRVVCGDIRMPTPNVFSDFTLCSTEMPSDAAVNPKRHWPPLTIPNSSRVARDVDNSPEQVQPAPRADQISETGFRLRRLPNMGGSVAFSTGSRETLATYGTLDPSLYTPTKEKPYQGIWVGDYSAHGCEFLLFLQRDHDGGSTRPTTASSTSQLSEQAKSRGSKAGTEDIVPHGRLEAIKLTGDPNVPRGEVSFIAEDIGRDGLVRVADEPLFRGSRIVHSKGHVAGLGFRDDTFLPSQLILESTDFVAHYWETMGHVSYFRRVDIDDLIQS